MANIPIKDFTEITELHDGDMTVIGDGSQTNSKFNLGKALNELIKRAETYTKAQIDTLLSGKQPTLVSGTNIKTINEQSLLGSGDIQVGGLVDDVQVDDVSVVQNKIAKINGLAKQVDLDETNRVQKLIIQSGIGKLFNFVKRAYTTYKVNVQSGAIATTLEKMSGNSLVANQLVQNGNFESGTSNWGTYSSSISVNSGILTMTYLGANAQINQTITNYQVKAHKYLISLDAKSNTDARFNLGIFGKYGTWGSLTSNWQHLTKIVEPNAGADPKILPIYFISGENGNTVDVSNIYLIDLTKMFGAGNEPTLQECQRLFTKEYYPYNEGSIVSANVDKIINNKQDQTLLQEISIPQSIQNLEGYGWGVNDIHNEVDFVNKKFIKRVGRVDLGTLNWSATSVSHMFSCVDLINIIKHFSSTAIAINGISNKLSVVKGNNVYDKTSQNIIGCAGNGAFWCYLDDSYTNATLFKEALSGTILYYELATPIEIDITEELEGFNNSFNVEGGGTLTFHNLSDYNVDLPTNFENMEVI